MNEYFCKSIFSSKNIVSCIPYKQKHDNSSLCIFFYNSHFEINEIFLDDEDRLVSNIVKKVYTGSKITWANISNEKVITFDSNSNFVISNFSIDYKKIFSHQLSSDTEQFDVIYVNNDRTFAFFCAQNSDRCYILNMMDIGNPKIHLRFFIDSEILDVCDSPDKHCLTLFYAKGETNYIATLNGITGEIIRDVETPPDTISVISSYSKTSVDVYSVTDKKLMTFKGEDFETIYTCENEIINNSVVFDNNIALITKSKTYLFNLLSNSVIHIIEESITEGNLLYNNVFFCNSGGDYYVICLKDDKSNFSSKKALKISSPIGSFSSAVKMKDNILVSDNKHTYLYNSIILSKEKIDLSIDNFQDKIFFYEGNVYVPFAEGTEIITDSESYTKESLLIDMFYIDNHYLMIYKDFVLVDNNPDSKIDTQGVVCADLNDSTLLLIYLNEINVFSVIKGKFNTNSYLEPMFNIKLELDEGTEIQSCSISAKYVALSINDKSTLSSSLIFYENSSGEIYNEFSFSSIICDTKFLPDGSKTYVSFINGVIATLLIQKATSTFACSYIYYGKACVSNRFYRHPLNDNVLFFFNECLHYIYDGIIFDVSIRDLLAFSLYYDEKNSSCFIVSYSDQGLYLYKTDPEISFYTPVSFINTQVLSFSTYDNFLFSLYVEKKVYYINISSFNGDHFKYISNIKIGESVATHCCIKKDDAVLLCCFGSTKIHCIIFNQINDSKYQAKVLFRQNISETPISSYQINEKYMILGFSDSVRVAEIDDCNSFHFLRAIKKTTSNVTFLSSYEGEILWAVADNSEIFCMIYNSKDDIFEMISTFLITEKVTAFTVLDEKTSAYSSDRGVINILSIDNDILLGLKEMSICKIPDLSITATFNIGNDIKFLFPFKTSLYYILDDGSICGITGSTISEEYRYCLEYQFNENKKMKNEVGFFNPKGSILSNVNLVVIDFLSCLESFTYEIENQKHRQMMDYIRYMCTRI